MKILFSSYVFPPSIGGIENVGLELSKRMKLRGHEVMVVTDTPGPDLVEDVPIFRNPSKPDIQSLFNNCDAVFGNHLSLRLLRPLITKPKKPHCILLHTHLRRTFPRNLLMSMIVRRGNTFAVSKHLARANRISEKVIYNGYDDEIFHNENQDASRKFDFLFVGRLVSDKGIEDLVDAMNLLPSYYSCMVVGDGPERANLEAQAPANMKFLGQLDSPYIAELMRQSKWVVVPSRWKEPFGLVAVEAIACGARVIAANHGGLPEAVGPCGLFFKPNNIRSLVLTMRTAMEREDMDGYTDQERENHLANFSYDKQVDSILQVLNR